MTSQVQDAERYFTLVSGHRIPAVGLGTWRSGSRANESVFNALVEVFHVKSRAFTFAGSLSFLLISRVLTLPTGWL